MSEKKRKITELQKISEKPDFWQNQEEAAEVGKEMENLKKEVEEFEALEKELKNFGEILDKEGEAGEKILEEDFGGLEEKFEKLDKKTLFSGQYDFYSAILSIMSGAGGMDAQDWSEMLLRMYLRFAEKNNFQVKILDESRGQEAGIKNATLEIVGPYAFGKLKSESGVHRLIRLSPFNADNLRQTSFSLVEILPVLPKKKTIEIKDQDLRIDVFRSSGAGGQSVNTTDSAVRITHIPTGMVATCQNERSQLQNKEQAMKILRAKLVRKQEEKDEQERNKLRGEKTSAEWGSQIRSYVLHPYKQVKDHRTGFETNQVEKVLEGDLENLIESYLRKGKK